MLVLNESVQVAESVLISTLVELHRYIKHIKSSWVLQTETRLGLVACIVSLSVYARMLMVS